MEKQSAFHLLEESSSLKPVQIVAELDRYIIGQNRAKRSVAIALRNRWRRQQVPGALREEIAPKNIILIGSTGVGKTEIARRLAILTDSPFIKVEASKFTEVGYVGRDVESMVRDLLETTISRLLTRERERVQNKAKEVAEERLLDLLLPKGGGPGQTGGQGSEPATASDAPAIQEAENNHGTREKLRKMLRAGKLDQRYVDLDVQDRSMPMVEIFSQAGMEEMGINFKDMLGNLLPKNTRRRKMTVAEAFQLLVQEEAQNMVDKDAVVKQAIEKSEQSGIIFLDEIDKIVGRHGGSGPDISREGVQRDLLPIVEGSTVSTKYGAVRTDHILFIASGAFHTVKPSELIPELQGRFPIRVELDALGAEEFVRILTEPENALLTQYTALLATEGVSLEFTQNAVQTLCDIAAEVNSRTENIGARRLHTVMESLLEDILFDAPDKVSGKIKIDADYVRQKLMHIKDDEDLSRFIL